MVMNVQYYEMGSNRNLTCWRLNFYLGWKYFHVILFENRDSEFNMLEQKITLNVKVKEATQFSLEELIAWFQAIYFMTGRWKVIDRFNYVRWVVLLAGCKLQLDFKNCGSYLPILLCVCLRSINACRTSQDRDDLALMIFLPFLFAIDVAATCVREQGANECWHFTGFDHDLVVLTLG